MFDDSTLAAAQPSGTEDLEARRSQYLAWLVNRAQPQPVDETADLLASQGARTAPTGSGDATMDMLSAQGANLNPPAPGGPAKQGLRGALLGVIRTMAYGAGQAGMKVAGLPTDEEKALLTARTRGLNASAAQDEAALKPRPIVNPGTGQYEMGPDGLPRMGTQHDQDAFADFYKVTGGGMHVISPEEAQAEGVPWLAGTQIAKRDAVALAATTEKLDAAKKAWQNAVADYAKDPSDAKLHRVQTLGALITAVAHPPQQRNATELWYQAFVRDNGREPTAQDVLAFQKENAQNIHMPPQGSWVPMTTDDGKQAFFNPTTGETRQAPDGMQKFDAQSDERLYKDVIAPAYEKETSYRMFQHAYQDYKKGAKSGAPSMVALSTHLATTFGNVKGSRITKDMIQHHLGARSISDDALVAVQKLSNGDTLSPKQWDDFRGLISESRRLAWETAKTEAAARGLTGNLNRRLPADLQGAPGGNASSGDDPFAKFGGSLRQ